MPLVWSSPSAWRQTLANLTAGRRLISDPGKWTVGAAARTATGLYLSSGSDADATCWCSYGAIQKVAGDLVEAEVIVLRAVVRAYAGDYSATIVTFNDSHSHKEVMAVWDLAIDAVKQIVKELSDENK